MSIFRPVNVIMVGITLILFWFFLVQPVLIANGILPLYNNLLFTALLVMTMLVTAGGYVINDLQDVVTDGINKPERSLIPEKVSRKSAMSLYIGLNGVALALAIFIFYKTQSFNIMALCAICIIILWLYSRYFKSTILMGNVVVSLLIGVIPFIFIILEANAFSELFEQNRNSYLNAYSVILSFTIFAFFANLIREVVKDCEDVEGDMKAGILTIATALGLRKSDMMNYVLTTLLFTSVIVWIFIKNVYHNGLELTLYIFLVVLPIIYLYYLLTKTDRRKGKYIVLSRHTKLIMFFGLIYLVIHLNMNYG